MDDKHTRPSALGRIGEMSAWAISVVAWPISYESQAALAQRGGTLRRRVGGVGLADDRRSGESRRDGARP